MEDKLSAATAATTTDDDQSPAAVDPMIQKRMDDKDSFIKQLQGENAAQRDTLTQLAEEKGKATGALEASKQVPKEEQKPSAFQTLKEKLSDEKFRDELDATPSKGVEAILAVLAEQGTAYGNDTREISDILVQSMGANKEQSEAAVAKMEEIMAQKLKDYPQQYEQEQEIAANREAIDTLKEDEVFKDLTDSQLLAVVKRSGDSSTGYQGAAGMGRRPVTTAKPQKVPKHVREQLLSVAMQLHDNNVEKAEKFVERHIARNGGI